MPAKRDRYSTLVAITKIALPLIALGLFASLFLYSKTNGIRDGLVFSDATLRQLASEAQITNPHFSGVTTGGDAFSVSATVAQPDAPEPGRIDLNDPSTTINFATGVDVQASADVGTLDIKANITQLSGNVRFETSDGYNAQAEIIRLNLRTGNINSDRPISASGPIGRIEAGGLEVRQELNKDPQGRKSVLIFKKGVKVIYTPVDTQE